MAIGTRQEAVARLAKLLKLAERAGSSEEAANAAARAQEVMDRFGLEKAEAIELGEAEAEEEQDEPIVDFGSRGAYLDVMDTAVVTWKARLALSLASVNACKMYSTRTRTPDRPVVVKYDWGDRKRYDRAALSIVGRPSDVATVRYLYTYLVREIDRLAREASVGCGRTWANNFRLGAVAEIANRLYAQKRKSEEDFRARLTDIPAERALVITNRALDRVRRRSEEVELWANRNLRLRKAAPSESRYDGGARAEGRRAGAGIALGAGGGRLGAGAKGLPAGRR